MCSNTRASIFHVNERDFTERWRQAATKLTSWASALYDEREDS